MHTFFWRAACFSVANEHARKAELKTLIGSTVTKRKSVGERGENMGTEKKNIIEDFEDFESLQKFNMER